MNHTLEVVFLWTPGAPCFSSVYMLKWPQGHAEKVAAQTLAGLLAAIHHWAQSITGHNPLEGISSLLHKYIPHPWRVITPVSLAWSPTQAWGDSRHVGTLADLACLVCFFSDLVESPRQGLLGCVHRGSWWSSQLIWGDTRHVVRVLKSGKRDEKRSNPSASIYWKIEQ